MWTETRLIDYLFLCQIERANKQFLYPFKIWSVTYDTESQFFSFVGSFFFLTLTRFDIVFKMRYNYLKVFLLLSLFCVVQAIELTFELPDNANQCFYEEIKAGVDMVVEYQVRFVTFWVTFLLFRLSRADNTMLMLFWRIHKAKSFIKKRENNTILTTLRRWFPEHTNFAFLTNFPHFLIRLSTWTGKLVTKSMADNVQTVNTLPRREWLQWPNWKAAHRRLQIDSVLLMVYSLISS